MEKTLLLAPILLIAFAQSVLGQSAIETALAATVTILVGPQSWEVALVRREHIDAGCHYGVGPLSLRRARLLPTEHTS